MRAMSRKLSVMALGYVSKAAMKCAVVISRHVSAALHSRHPTFPSFFFLPPNGHCFILSVDPVFKEWETPKTEMEKNWMPIHPGTAEELLARMKNGLDVEVLMFLCLASLRGTTRTHTRTYLPAQSNPNRSDAY